ncbi:hypothetical protein Nepgr_016999 [Nepenthes gracilis]|uniref:F-box domain-containing protein n=1 Tax=Nepenthes gracilis TaxID=150966 RepID=A0AAD3SPN6_NEPGR|nr:hypothetical protein Nepgr_016999 [Nepenthes gracilis]
MLCDSLLAFVDKMSCRKKTPFQKHKEEAAKNKLHSEYGLSDYTQDVSGNGRPSAKRRHKRVDSEESSRKRHRSRSQSGSPRRGSSRVGEMLTGKLIATERRAVAERGPSHEALFLVLAYLPLPELLATIQVCRSLRDAVNDDVLSLMNHLIVEKPLNRRISDGTLIKITSKAQGRLTALALINCPKITDDGLLNVVAKNPNISKLHIPGCTGITPEGILKAVNSLTQPSHHLASLKINGIYHINQNHLETLHSYLSFSTPQNRNPQFYNQNYTVTKSLLLSRDDGHHTIDVEVCPICNEVKMVFDCPREICKKRLAARECRGCYHCIERCVECGSCFVYDGGDEQQGDAVCSDALCWNCWLQLPKCNHCNKPYCRRHGQERQSSPAVSTGFLCDICLLQYQHPDY